MNRPNATRRQLLRDWVGSVLSLGIYADAAVPEMSLGNDRLDRTYRRAVTALKGNIQQVHSFPAKVLFEGAEYPGVWLECAPLEGLVYEPFSPEVALNNHDIFFKLQRSDGYLPCSVRRDKTGSGQIQMAVPIAATAWELYGRNGNAAFLDRAYVACSRWDEWLMRYRNTRRTGLCEAFCTYDTGQDNSPRFAGIPNRCLDDDARLCPKVNRLPFLAPDLSATVYGGRIALAAMAKEMNHRHEQARWLEQAELIRKAILLRLYDPDEGAFYDRDSDGQFVKIRGDAITRVLGEHVPDQEIFEEVFRLQIRNPQAFWSAYPFPSIALNDPKFVRPIPRNSWGGASQALTALRSPRWLEHYGKFSELSHLMNRWVEAIAQAGDFLQQLDPESGEFIGGKPGYSPAALVFLDFTSRLYGVRASGDELEWNCRLPLDSTACTSSVRSGARNATLQTNARVSNLLISGRRIAQIEGEVRLTTTRAGRPVRLIGTAPRTVNVVLRSLRTEKKYPVRENETVSLTNDFGIT